MGRQCDIPYHSPGALRPPQVGLYSYEALSPSDKAEALSALLDH